MKLGHDFCFMAPTHNSTGSVDADALPSALVYEDHGAALGYAPTVAKVDTGEYHVYGTASAANGFQVGHDYNVVMVAVIGGQTWKSRVGQFTVDDNGIDDVDAVVDAIKTQTDKMNFTGTDIKATLDGEKVAVSAIDAGTIAAATFAAGAIDASAVAHDAITADKIADDAIEPGMFSDLVPADVVEVSGDAAAADNLESQFDGTGLTGDRYPARQDQANDIYTDTQRVDGLIELDGGHDRFTAAALEEAPSGGGYTPEDVADAVLDCSGTDHLLLGSPGFSISKTAAYPAVFLSKSESASAEVELDPIIKSLVSAAPGLGNVYSFKYSDKDGSRCDGLVRYVSSRNVVRIAGGSASLSPYTLTFEISDSNGAWKWTHAMASVAVTG